MEITINVPDADVKKLVGEILENLPECCICLDCTRWNYDNNTFQIEEDVDGDGCNIKKHKLTLPKAVKAFKELVQKWLAGGRYTYEQVMDAGYWDAPMIDSLVQVAVLGEDRYG